MGEKCKARVSDSTGFHFYQCDNKARYGEFCGIHSPEKQAERAKKRGPTQFERLLKRHDDEKKEREELVARLEQVESDARRYRKERDEAVGLVKRLVSWCGPWDTHPAVEDARALLAKEPRDG